MRNKFIYLLVIIIFGYSCSESGSESINDIFDIGTTDLISVSDYDSLDVIDDLVDVEKDAEVILDIISSDSQSDTQLSDIKDVSFEDAEERDVMDVEDITFSDLQEDTISDVLVMDIVFNDIATDVIDSGFEDTDITDVGSLDLGTKRGLLFSAREKFKTKPSIFYVDPQGGVPQRLSPDISDEFTRPFWSPDGNSFYFESSGKIYKTPFGKFEPVEICSGMDFAVSPDEKLIALNKYVKINEFGEYDYEMFIYNIETGKYTQVTNFVDGEMQNRPSSPSFSPDSKKILFSILNPTGAYDVYSSDLFIYDIETKFLVNITNEAKKIQAKVANRSPEWSPLMDRYAYMHILYPESGYYVVDGLAKTVRVSDEVHNGIDGVAFSPNANALAIITHLGKGISIIDLKGKILYELPILDLEYIDNLSWK